MRKNQVVCNICRDNGCVEIISKCKDVDEAMFYVKQTVDEGWSKNFAEADVISLV